MAKQHEVRLLFGIGGRVRLVLYATGDGPTVEWDITCAAARLTARGLDLCARVCPPKQAGGQVIVDLGEGGRALWVDGGGDITGTEVAMALTAAIDALDGNGVHELLMEITAAARAEFVRYARQILVELGGLTPSQANGWLRRGQVAFDGRSVRTVLNTPYGTIDDMKTATLLTCVRALETSTKDVDAVPALMERISAEELRAPWPIASG